MIKLDKWEKEYVTGHIPHWRNPITKHYEKYPIPPERKAVLDSLIVTDSDHLLYMDSHGVNINLCAFKETESGPLLGFLYGTTSEETIFDYWANDEIAGPFEIKRKEIVAWEYSKADGSRWER